MQKFVVATAILATTAMAVDPIYCKVTNKAADKPTDCSTVTSVEDFTLDSAVTWTPAIIPANVIKFTPTNAATTCADVSKEAPDVATCFSALDSATAVTEPEGKCIPATAQGASVACGIAKDGTCSATAVCVEGLDCTDSKCVDPPAATDYYCKVTSTAAGHNECSAQGVTVVDQTSAATFDPARLYIKVTAVADATTPCATAAGKSDDLAACLKAVAVSDINADEQTCVVTGPTGINSTCPIAADAACTDAAPNCVTGYTCKEAAEGKTCQKDEAVVTPFQCQVSQDVSTGNLPDDCTAAKTLFSKYDSKATFDPAQFFAEINQTGAETNPCAAAIADTTSDVGKCLKALTGADLSADVRACVDEGTGKNASCPLADGASCATAGFVTCKTGSTCDATTKKCTAAATTYAALLTGFPQETKEDLLAALNKIFVAAPAPMGVTEDPVANACQGTTVKSIDGNFFPSRAYATMSGKPSADCMTQVAADKNLTLTVADQAATDQCSTKCGAATCPCQKDMTCHYDPVPEDGKNAQADCQEGLLCDLAQTPTVCVNSGVYASAALAVAAAVLAVIF